MTIGIQATDFDRWDSFGLNGILDGAEMTFRNETDSGCGDSQGDWFLIPDAPVVAADGKRYHVIISGTHGNDHSPGATHYTSATLYDADDPEDTEDFQSDSRRWEAMPETLDTDTDGLTFSVVEYLSGFEIRHNPTGTTHWLAMGLIACLT